jgi:hypothetical protein
MPSKIRMQYAFSTWLDRDMIVSSPVMIAGNGLDTRGRYSVLKCELAVGNTTGFITLADITNLLKVQFRMCRSAFEDHILVVIRVGAEKQMGGVDTAAVVAAVQNIQAIGGTSVMDFPTNTMNVRMPVSTAARYLSVSTRMNVSNPFPTLVSFLNFRPETIFNRLSFTCHAVRSLVRDIIAQYRNQENNDGR